MSTPADLVAWLVADGLGLTATVNLFYGVMAESPDVQICLRPYSGGGVEHVLGSNAISVSWPFVQIVSRGAAYDFDGPAATLVAVANSLSKIGDQVIGSTMYHAVLANQPPFPLRQDANFRWEHICNFRIMKDGL